MKRTMRLLLAGIALSIPLVCTATAQSPPLGSYGFDQMKPETTHCAKLDAAQIAKFKNCTYSKSNNFGDDRPGYACAVNSKSAFMAYKTLADCKAELELEKANGD